MFQTIADVIVLSAVGYLVYLYRSVIVPFSNSYSGEKGKRLATHEDFEQILAEQRLVTRDMELIKTQIGDEVWLRQTVWRERRETYVALIACLDRVQWSFSVLANSGASETDPVPTPLLKQLKRLTRMLSVADIFLEDDLSKSGVAVFREHFTKEPTLRHKVARIHHVRQLLVQGARRELARAPDNSSRT